MSTAAVQIDSTIEVVTPENIAFHYQAAGPFRRLTAFVIDLMIRQVVFWSVVVIGMCAGAGPLFLTVMLIIWFLQGWFYGGLFETWMNGRTPGKWVMGVRVVSTDGQPISGLQAILRNILRWVDMFPMVSLYALVPLLSSQDLAPMYLMPTFLVGLVAMTLSSRYQRLGDLVCGTMVVVDEREWLAGVAQVEDAETLRLAEQIPADFRISPSLARSLAMYVDRRRYFSPARRREIAAHVAERLVRKFGLPADASYDQLLCALYYRAFIADRGPDELPPAAADPAAAAPAAPTTAEVAT